MVEVGPRHQVRRRQPGLNPHIRKAEMQPHPFVPLDVEGGVLLDRHRHAGDEAEPPDQPGDLVLRVWAAVRHRVRLDIRLRHEAKTWRILRSRPTRHASLGGSL